MTKTVALRDCDAIQFPRLLAEISRNIEFNKDELASLREAMGLTQDELAALFDRAGNGWKDVQDRALRHDVYAVVLDERFSETERGNIWLTNVEEPGWENAWIRIAGDLWLEIDIRPCNYPGLTVQLIRSSDKKLAAHIRKTFRSGSWRARKLNIEGVKTDKEGMIQ